MNRFFKSVWHMLYDVPKPTVFTVVQIVQIQQSFVFMKEIQININSFQFAIYAPFYLLPV